jgi:hypothetical protein
MKTTFVKADFLLTGCVKKNVKTKNELFFFL